MAVPEPPPPSLIFDFAQFDEEDAVDTEMSQAHGQLLESLKGKSEIEIHNYLQESASVSMKKHAEIINGLLYGILTNRDTAREQFQHLNFVARDSLAFALRQTRYFCSLHQFHKIRPQVREQLVWLVNELTVVRVHGVEALYLNLLRQIRGGDISQPNIQLAEAMLKLLQTHLQPWVYMFPHLVAFSCFTYLRLMLDHSRFVPLRQAEATFCAKLLRERFRDCSDIGRDLVRALQDVARIKEIEEIWQDLLYSPSKLNPQLEGIHQLMAMPTREVYLQSRLTYDMEHKLLHILKHIHFGQHHRNMQWFMDRYLTAPEADALHCDLIRYICCVYHPTNAVLASTIVPRWVLIGGVLRAIKSNVTAANVKLALFYDWLFYDPAKDNIMNIEPAMLLMERSLERYPYITSILFEFLHFVTENYYPPLRDRIHLHVQQAGQALVEKGVIRSLHLIYQAPVFADYPPIRKYMAIMFPNILGDVAESTTGTSIENSLADSSSENNSPQPDSETFDSSNESGVMDEYEYASSSHPSFSTLQDTDDEEQGERQEQKSRDSSRESSREPMHVDEPTRSSTVKANDEEEEEEDEVMESSVAEPAPQQQQSRDLGADALGDWTFAGESDVIGSASKDDLGTTAATPVPGASLWIFGSSLQEFKKAYETNPESSETSNMFKHIWEVYGDVAGAGVVGSDIAHEIGHEICAFAQKTELAENYFSDPADQADKTSTASGSDDSTGTIDALTTCLWRVTKRDGEEGAQRVAEMMIKSEAHMARSERMLGMWYLLGLLRGQLLEVASPFTTLASLSRVSGTADTPSLQDAVQLYGMYLETSASQDISTTMDETDATSQELVQECLERDLQRIQDRQLEIFDTVLPLVLQYLPEFIPRTAQFLKMVLAMAIPSQVYRLSSGLMRGDFVLFSPLSPKMSTKDRTEQSDSSATQTSKMSKNMKSGTKQENTGSLFMGAGARDTADGRHLITSQTLDVLGQTLEWGVFEQLAVWQLVLSEYGGNTDAIAELLRATWVPGMTISTHPESLGGLLNLSRTVSSSSPPNLKLGVSLVRIAAASKDSQVTDSLSWTSFAPTPTSQDMMEFCQTWMLTWTRDFPEPVVEVLLYLSDKTSTPVETTLGISGGSSGSTVSNGDTEQENNTSTKNLRNSRSRSGHVRTKLTPRQRKEQGNYLRVTLKLLQFCWESLERYPQESLSVRDRRRQAFLDIWSARVKSQVRDALVENFGTGELESWPSAWWAGPERSKAMSKSSKTKRGAHTSDDDEDPQNSEDAANSEDNATQDEDEDEDLSVKRENKLFTDSEDDTTARNRKWRTDKSESDEDQENGNDEDEDMESVGEQEQNVDNDGRGRKSASTSRRNSPKNESSPRAMNRRGSAGSGILNSRSKGKNAASASKTSTRKPPAKRGGALAKRKRKISEDDDENDEEEGDDDDEEENDDDEDKIEEEDEEAEKNSEEEQDKEEDDEEDDEGKEEDSSEASSDEATNRRKSSRRGKAPATRTSKRAIAKKIAGRTRSAAAAAAAAISGGKTKRKGRGSSDESEDGDDGNDTADKEDDAEKEDETGEDDEDKEAEDKENNESEEEKGSDEEEDAGEGANKADTEGEEDEEPAQAEAESEEDEEDEEEGENEDEAESNQLPVGSKRKAAASANSKLLASKSSSRDSPSSPSSSSSSSSAAQPTNKRAKQAKSKGSTANSSSVKNKARRKPKRRIVSDDDESDE